MALMKERSPSCGAGFVHDGAFSGKIVEGQGIVSREISKFIPVYSENELLGGEKTLESALNTQVPQKIVKMLKKFVCFSDL